MVVRALYIRLMPVSYTHLTYKNKITSLPAEEMWSGNKKWVKGGSLYDFYLVEWAGDVYKRQEESVPV